MPDVADAQALGSSGEPMPEELSSRHLKTRLLQLGVLVVLVALIIWLTPGLSSLRHRLGHAQAGWLVLAAVAELLSALSYVVVFRYVFCARMSWRLSYRIGMAEQAANSLLPAGGAGGLALGAWALSRGGMRAEHIARRTVAFFLLTSLANFAALILFAVAFATGAFSGDRVPWFTYGFAIAALVAIVLVLALPWLHSRFIAPRPKPSSDRGRITRLARDGVDALANGVRDAVWLLRERPAGVLGGSIGYMVFDIATLGLCFNAFGYTPPFGVLVVAYLIGQLGGLLPLPGGIGGIEGGLIGAYALYHVPVSASGAAVLGYRVLALWIPAVLGSIAFVRLRGLLRGRRQDAIAMCEPLADPIRVDLARRKATGQVHPA